MNNRIKLYFANFLVMTAGLWMASCSASDDNLVSDKGADVAKNEKVLTLRINTGATSFGSRTTDITTDPGAAAENTINRLTIGIFSSDGNSVKFLQDLNSGATGSNSFTTTATSTTATIVASALAKDDKVLVAVNAPANTFVGVSNVAGFNAKADQAVAALTYTAAAEKENATEENNNIPMYGESVLATTDNKNFTSTVNVIHLLSKVSLESLYVDFANSGSYSTASFIPTTIFLINEPDALLFNKQAWAGTGNLLNGFAQTDKLHGTYKEFLATKTLAEKKLSGVHQGNAQSNFDTKCYFYTMPNSEVQTGGKNTKLVVAGKFKSNTTSPEETVYYPVALNAKYEENSNSYVAAETGTDVYKVYPNKNYKCTVVIRAKGAASPFDNLDPKKATITVTVSPFTDVTQTTVFK